MKHHKHCNLDKEGNTYHKKKGSMCNTCESEGLQVILLSYHFVPLVQIYISAIVYEYQLIIKMY